MTLEEKLDRMRVTSMEEARANGNEIIAKHKASVDQLFNDHKEVALRQSELSIKTERNNSKQRANKAISTCLTELKREQGRVQAQLKNNLFALVEEKLDDYMKTDAYVEQLVTYINKAKEFAEGASISIYVNSSDEDKIPQLEKLTDVTLTVYKEEMKGGIRAVIHDRNILMNYSFSAALAEQYDNFRFSGGGIND